MQRKSFAASLIPLAAALLVSCNLRADDGWDRAVLVINEENDSRFSDRHYTQGSRLAFLSRDHTNETAFTTHLPSVGYDAVRWKWGIEGGQEIYTPEDITASHLI